MIERIEEDVIKIYDSIQKEGYEVYLVGGCVRDLFLERDITDWDLTTNATPEQIQSIFPESFYDNTYGTVGIPYEIGEKKRITEITTYRTEKGFLDKRHPEHVEWGKSIEEDLSRRDFTVNAIALKITSLSPFTFNIVDPYNGREDIEKKLIRAVGNADKRFKEDALRLMRAIRFTTQLEFTIEEKTWNAVLEDSSLISHVSFERIRDELFKILKSSHPHEGIQLLDQVGILDIIIPELTKGKGVSQVRPGRHHTTDVFTHNLLALKETPSTDPIVRLATLLHDVGKPYVAGVDEDGYIIFYNHEVRGAKIASLIADRLRLSKKERLKIYTLIRWHMFTIDETITDSAIRRFIRRVGIENVKDIIDLRIGDRLGSGTQTAESWRLKKFKERIEGQLNPPFSINDLAINGTDIMRELKIPPGPQIGKILKTLFEEVDENLEKNTKEYLLKRIKDV